MKRRCPKKIGLDYVKMHGVGGRPENSIISRVLIIQEH